MTRAIDRLIVSGAIDPERSQDRETPIGWVLGRLGAEGEIERVSADPVELERGDARFLLAVDRWAPRAAAPEPEPIVTEAGQLALFAELPTEPAPRGYRLPGARAAAGAAAAQGQAALVLGARAVRALLLPLLRRARRRPARGARHRARARTG